MRLEPLESPGSEKRRARRWTSLSRAISKCVMGKGPGDPVRVSLLRVECAGRVFRFLLVDSGCVLETSFGLEMNFDNLQVANPMRNMPFKGVADAITKHCRA